MRDCHIEMLSYSISNYRFKFRKFLSYQFCQALTVPVYLDAEQDNGFLRDISFQWHQH